MPVNRTPKSNKKNKNVATPVPVPQFNKKKPVGEVKNQNQTPKKSETSEKENKKNPPTTSIQDAAVDAPNQNVPVVQQPPLDDTDPTPFHGYTEFELAMDADTSKELASHFRLRSQVKQKLMRIHRSLQSEQSHGLAQLTVTSRTLSKIYDEFSEHHNKAMAMVPDEAVAKQEDVYADFEDAYNRISTAVEELILVAKNKPEPPKPQVVIHQQPLKVPIPTFDGSYSSWPKFKAVFQDLMANSGDTDAVKLYHLDKALVGEAAGILDAKVMSEGNYQQAWEILSDRFENQRIIVETHIRGLLSLKKMASESHKELRALLNEATRHVESLRFLKQEITGVSEHFIVFLITTALDKSTRKAWESTQKKGELPKYEQTLTFLKSRCQILENCEAAFQSQPPAVKPKPTAAPPKVQSQRSHAVATESRTCKNACEICGGPHRNYECSALSNLTAAQRNEKVRAAGVCFNCLRKGHRSKDCPSDKVCRTCQRRHHTLLHEDGASNRKVETKPNVSVPVEAEVPHAPVPASPPSQPAVVRRAPAPAESSVSTSCSCNSVQPVKTVLLLTAVVYIIDSDRQMVPCRVLLDSGSQVNFITEEMANRLGVKKQRANVPITGINALRSLARDKVTIRFRSRVSSFQATLECLITPKVTAAIPTSKIDVSGWTIPNGVILADPAFHTPDKVDMLIGAELFFDILKPDHIRLGDNLPQLRDTHLGWIVSGTIKEAYSPSVTAQHANLASIEDVEKMMQRFWQIEELPDVPKLSREELACEDHFLSTYKRDQTGRFVVKLPLKENAANLSDCRALALKRFLMLEKRLTRDPELQKQYVAFIREYEALGHCHEVKEAEDPPDQKNFYLPHHAVLRPSSSSTKCRVVFDASAKAFQPELSLNEVLQVGPVVQSDLFSIVLRFRKHLIAFSADVSKMYRQIFVAPEDRHYQRIFWREDPSKPLRVLELDTVTYGTASAPYQATRCLNQLAEEDGEEFPVAARIVKKDVYMDDTLSGADTVSEAIEARRQLTLLLDRGGFPIHKWCSNSPEFMEQIPEEDREKQKPLEDRGVNQVIKVLGLLWDPVADTLLIANPPSPPASPPQPVTKRMIYAEIARLFDPLGIFSPVIVLAKQLGQQVWCSKAGWDDPVNDELLQQWEELRCSLPQLSQIQVPRCVTLKDVVTYELHGFSDASNRAYGACVYLRSVFADGSAKLSLLCSKSKLAPLHDLSIPRKELCAALLLTRLVEKVVSTLDMTFREVVLWCDSTIVLAWIKKPLNELQLFVRNRIAVIQASTSSYCWQYIRSQDNPADIVSRGQLPEALVNNSLWWNGPTFLQQSEYEAEETQEVPDEMLPETKVVVAAAVESTDPFPFFSKFSNYRQTQRVMCYVLRFIGNCRKKSPAEREMSPYFTIPELQKSTEAIIRVIQLTHLEDEIRRVNSNEPCKRIGNLRPIYRDGLLRVGGRLDRSHLPFESRHPIILPDKDPVVRSMIRQMHNELLHIGQTNLMNVMRQRYWLLNARSTIRLVTRSCVRCFRTNPTSTTQLMGNLPTSRVVPSPPFAVTGIDYAGPFWVRQGTHRPAIVKAYVAVYVCMTTKAVHLEVVSDLSTDAYLASLRRFVSRRGLVYQLHSDNATNFRGAHNEMNELYHQFQNQQAVQRIQQFCQAREIEWHFIPPDAPEFGGLWEAAVKSAKTHLKRVVGDTRLTFEELSTVLAEIEAVLNSRPLFSVSNDPADPLVITPAHYLIGRPLIAMAEPSLEDVNEHRLTRWQHLQLMREQFWRAWSKDYLNTLQPRKKNLRTMPNIREGMVVLLHDRNQPPLSWKLGRISAVYPGNDGLVRAVDVFADGSTFRRPINKISVLPIEDNVSSEQEAVDTSSQPGGVCSVCHRSETPHCACASDTQYRPVLCTREQVASSQHEQSCNPASINEPQPNACRSPTTSSGNEFVAAK